MLINFTATRNDCIPQRIRCMMTPLWHVMYLYLREYIVLYKVMSFVTHNVYCRENVVLYIYSISSFFLVEKTSVWIMTFRYEVWNKNYTSLKFSILPCFFSQNMIVVKVYVIPSNSDGDVVCDSFKQHFQKGGCRWCGCPCKKIFLHGRSIYEKIDSCFY